MYKCASHRQQRAFSVESPVILTNYCQSQPSQVIIGTVTATWWSSSFHLHALGAAIIAATWPVTYFCKAKVLNAAFIIFVTRMVSERYVKVPPVCIVGKQIQQFCFAQYFWQVTVDPCVVLRYLSVSSMGCPMPISLSQVDCLEILMLSQIVFSFSLLIKVVIYNGRVLHLEGNLLPPSWLRTLATINTIVQWMGTCRLELYNSIKSGALVVLCWFSILNIMYRKADVVKK